MKLESNTLAEIILAKADLAGLPVSGTLELTPNCNMNCKMCYVKEGHDQVIERGGLLPMESWLSIVDEAMKQGLLFVLLTGGEPVLHPEFESIYREISRKGIHVSLNSNGTMFREEHYELFDQYRPRRINISLYGASPATYRKLCGYEAGYEKATEAIRRLHSMDINLCIHITVTPENANDLEEIFAFANSLEIPVEATSYMFPAIRRSCGQEDGYRFSPTAAAANTIRINRCISGDGALSMDLEQYECSRYDQAEKMDYSKILCRAGHSVCWVTWDGKIAPCGMMQEPQYSVLEGAFAEGWEKVHAFAQNLRLSSACASCKDRPFCTVCAAKAFAETGSFQGKPEYLCAMTGEVRRQLKKLSDDPL